MKTINDILEKAGMDMRNIMFMISGKDEITECISYNDEDIGHVANGKAYFFRDDGQFGAAGERQCRIKGLPCDRITLPTFEGVSGQRVPDLQYGVQWIVDMHSHFKNGTLPAPIENVAIKKRSERMRQYHATTGRY